MKKEDYYEVLGIDRSANQSTIKQAFRKLAMKYHPDKNPGDEHATAKMRKINEAYAVLSDPHKRRQYDTYGHAGLEGYTMEDIFSGVDFWGLFREFGLGDIGFGFGSSIFDGLFGGGRAAGQPRRGADLRYSLDVTLEEAAFGAEKKIELPRMHICKSCNGTGAKERGLRDCEPCKGSGQIVTEQRSGYSIFRQITTCGNCHGKGKTIQDPCEKCEGKGFLEMTSELTASVPAGADTGYAIKIAGEGEAGAEGAVPGDLYVVLHIERHPIFERHGDDVFVSKEISFVQAALGDTVDDVPSLTGNVELEIPEGTQTGTMFRITGKGMPRLTGDGSGDEYVTVKVITPRNLTLQEKTLLREFGRLREEAKDE